MKKAAVISFILTAVFFLPSMSAAAVLYDSSLGGYSFGIANTGAATTNSYLRVIGSDYSFPTTQYRNLYDAGTTTKLRIKRLSGVGCGSILNVSILKDDGTGLTMASPATTTGGYCDFTSTGGPPPNPLKFAGVAVCVNNGCTNADGTLVLDGNPSNIGGTYKGDASFASTGGFAFQICDDAGCGEFGTSSAIPWESYSYPLVFSTSSQAIATSSGLWDSLSTTTMPSCVNAGNIFSEGLCTVFVFLFVPNPNVLNEFMSLPTLINEKFPFSYATGFYSAFNGLSASSTDNFLSVSINFHDIGMGSTTPFGNFVPNLTVLSTTTILTYITQSQWDFVQLLIAGGLWLMLAFDIFFTVRDKLHKV